MRASKETTEEVKEKTGFYHEVTVDETEDGFLCTGIIAGKKITGQSKDKASAELKFLDELNHYLTDIDIYKKQQIITDKLLFQVMMLEDVFCNIAAQSRHELMTLRIMEYNQKKPSENRKMARDRRNGLIYEIEGLRTEIKKYTSSRTRLVTKIFDRINDEETIEARDNCVDFFIGSFELFLENSKDVGTVIYPAVSVKKPNWSKFKTIIAK